MNSDGFDLSNVCRLCLRSCPNLKNIFSAARSNDQSSLDLSAKILGCVSLEILPTDRGPHTVCDRCLDNVNLWYEFNVVCQVSNAILSKYLNDTFDVDQKNAIPGSAETSASPRVHSSSEHYALPEISMLSHDSLLDRSLGLESNVSPTRDFCPSPTSPYSSDGRQSGGRFPPPASGAPSSSSSSSSANAVSPVSTCGAAAAAASASGANARPHLSRAPAPATVTCAPRRAYACELCDLAFPRFAALLGHDGEAHAAGERQRCSVCGGLFVSAGRLKTHHDVAHGRRRSFRCASCAKMFASKKSLSVHQRLHTGQYKCGACDFVCTSKLYLGEHVKRRHEEGGAVSFECQTCRERFAHRSSLLRHQKLHATDRGKLFGCATCDLRTRSASELGQHAVTHGDAPPASQQRPFACRACRKTFASKKSLAMHERRHQPPATHLVCDVCHKGLYSRHELRVHRETHSDCKAFACFHCDKRFSFKNTLARHLKKYYARVRSDVQT